MVSQRSFPFMKLPIELRLMVYERLPVDVRRHDFERLNNPRDPSVGSYAFAILSSTVDLDILAASRQVYGEAVTIMRAKMEYILSTPPRMIIDLTSTPKMHKCGGPLWHIQHYLAKRAVAARKDLGSVPYVGTGMGAAGSRYSPGTDLDYQLLAKLVETWSRGLDYQRKSAPLVENVSPVIELALTAPPHWPQDAVDHALRQLAYVLFAENGGFRFELRIITHLFPARTHEMRRQERALVKKVMWGRSVHAVKAVAGSAIEREEYEAEWGENSFLLL